MCFQMKWLGGKSFNWKWNFLNTCEFSTIVVSFFFRPIVKILIFLLSLPVILIIFFGYNFYNEKKNTRISNQFNEANKLLENDRKQEAKKIFISLNDEKHLF